MSGSISKADKTRQYIIEKTASVFNAKGYSGTSLSDLTTATGLTKGSIYGNFENKDEVALAAFDYNFAEITKYMKERILATENSIDRLLAYPKVYRNFLTIAFLQTGCPILNTSTEADDTHPILRARAADAVLFWKSSLIKQVKRGVERKEIKLEVNADEVAVVIISLIEGAIMQAKVVGRSTELKIAMEFLERYINGLKQ